MPHAQTNQGGGPGPRGSRFCSEFAPSRPPPPAPRQGLHIADFGEETETEEWAKVCVPKNCGGVREMGTEHCINVQLGPLLVGVGAFCGVERDVEGDVEGVIGIVFFFVCVCVILG